MTEDYGHEETPLPGLAPATGRESAVESAARRSITELHALGYVKDHHAVVCAVIVAAAQAIDRGASSGRASAVAMAMKELREAFLLLIPAEEGGAQGDEGWLTFERDFREAAEKGRG